MLVAASPARRPALRLRRAARAGAPTSARTAAAPSGRSPSSLRALRRTAAGGRAFLRQLRERRRTPGGRPRTPEPTRRPRSPPRSEAVSRGARATVTLPALRSARGAAPGVLPRMRAPAAHARARPGARIRLAAARPLVSGRLDLAVADGARRRRRSPRPPRSSGPRRRERAAGDLVGDTSQLPTTLATVEPTTATSGAHGADRDDEDDDHDAIAAAPDADRSGRRTGTGYTRARFVPDRGRAQAADGESAAGAGRRASRRWACSTRRATRASTLATTSSSAGSTTRSRRRPGRRLQGSRQGLRQRLRAQVTT